MPADVTRKCLAIITAVMLLPVHSLAQSGTSETARIKALVTFAKARTKVVAREEKEWMKRTQEAQRRGLDAYGKQQWELQDAYWREKGAYENAWNVAARERELLQSMLDIERYGLNTSAARDRLQGAVMQHTTLPVSYRAGRFSPDVESVMRVSEATKGGKDKAWIEILGREVAAHQQAAFAMGQFRITVEYYLSVLGRPNLEAQLRRRADAIAAERARYAARDAKLARDTDMATAIAAGIIAVGFVAALLAGGPATVQDVERGKERVEEANRAIQSSCFGADRLFIPGNSTTLAQCLFR